MSFKRILIAVDESTFAAHAADVGIELAKALGAEAAFFHAIDPASVYAPGVPREGLIRTAEQEAKQLVGAFRARAGATLAVLDFVEFGDPAPKVVERAKNWSADLIVMGTHGRGGVPRLLLGSVAEAVLRHAACPVLVVRAQT